VEGISPLFSIEANNLLMSGLSDVAILLCEKNLEYFPFYPTCYIILIKALIFKNDFSKAKEYVDIGKELFPSLTVFQVLDSELNELISQSTNKDYFHYVDLDANGINEDNKLSLLSNDKKDISFEEKGCLSYSDSPIIFMYEDLDNNSHIILQDSISENKDIKKIPLNNNTFKLLQFQHTNVAHTDIKAHILSLIPGLMISPLRFLQKRTKDYNHIKPLPTLPPFPNYIENIWNINNHYSPYQSDFQDLYSLAKEVIHYSSHSQDNPDKTIETSNNEDNNEAIEITETFANILFQQKAYKEALKAYKTLIAKNPEKKEYFHLRIEEINAFILSDDT